MYTRGICASDTSCPKLSVFLLFVAHSPGFSQHENLQTVRIWYLICRCEQILFVAIFWFRRSSEVCTKIMNLHPKFATRANTSNAALRVTQSTKPSPEVSSSSGKQETTKFQVKAHETNPVTETSSVKYILCEQGHNTGQCEWSVLI